MSKKINYEQMSEEILQVVGGAENLKKISHCFTRLRLDPVELDKCDIEAIKKIEGCKGCVVNNGQVQVIIGREVEDLFPIFLKKTKKAETEEKPENGKKDNIVNRILNGIASIFIPVFPALAAGGLLKGILLALNFGHVVDPTGDTFTMLMMISDAAFYFLPICLAISASKVFNTKTMVAVVLAGILIHPTYTGLEASTTLFGMTIPVVSYASTVFPIIVGVYILSWVEKFFKKFLPKSITGLFTPLLCILVTAPIMLIAVGPAINTLSNNLGNVIIDLYNTTGAFGGAVFGAVYPFLVFTGLHHAVVPVELQSLAANGYDPLLAMCAAANASVAGAAIMVAIDTKDKDFRALSLSSAFTALVGTTEPALYGVLGILKRPFIGAAAGGAVGAGIMAAFKVYGSGLGPVPGAGFALFLGDKFAIYIIGIVVAVAVSMVVTHFVKAKDVAKEE